MRLRSRLYAAAALASLTFLALAPAASAQEDVAFQLSERGYLEKGAANVMSFEDFHPVAIRARWPSGRRLGRAARGAYGCQRRPASNGVSQSTG